MRQDKPGVLLVNLGTPDAPTTPAVKRYLKQFSATSAWLMRHAGYGGHCLISVFCQSARRACQNSTPRCGWMKGRR